MYVLLLDESDTLLLHVCGSKQVNYRLARYPDIECTWIMWSTKKQPATCIFKTYEQLLAPCAVLNAEVRGCLHVSIHKYTFLHIQEVTALVHVYMYRDREWHRIGGLMCHSAGSTGHLQSSGFHWGWGWGTCPPWSFIHVNAWERKYLYILTKQSYMYLFYSIYKIVTNLHCINTRNV